MWAGKSKLTADGIAAAGFGFDGGDVQIEVLAGRYHVEVVLGRTLAWVGLGVDAQEAHHPDVARFGQGLHLVRIKSFALEFVNVAAAEPFLG